MGRVRVSGRAVVYAVILAGVTVACTGVFLLLGAGWAVMLWGVALTVFGLFVLDLRVPAAPVTREGPRRPPYAVQPLPPQATRWSSPVVGDVDEAAGGS